MDRRPLICALLSTLLLAACGDIEEPIADTQQAFSFPDFTGVNGLKPGDEWAARPDSVILLGETFKQSRTTARMYDSASGKYTLIKLAQCGLPDGHAVRITNNSGVWRDFEGHFGLVPGWASRPPSATEARWVRGCIGALLNAYGVEVRVSMRGANPAYHPGTTEQKLYTFEEAAWFGQGDDLYAVVGKDLWKLCGVAAVPQLQKRVCARATPGSPGCPNVTVLGRWDQVCSGRSGNVLSGCKVGARVFNEVTTSMLETSTITTCEDYAP